MNRHFFYRIPLLHNRSTCRRICFIAAVLVTTTQAHAASLDGVQVDAPSSGVELGLGFDMATGDMVPNRCIVFAPVQEGGQQSTLRLSETSSHVELAQHLGVSASAHVKGFVGGASAQVQLVQDTKTTGTQTIFALRAAVKNGVLFAGPRRRPAERRFAFTPTVWERRESWVQNPKDDADNDRIVLSDWAVPLVDDGSFRKNCGDHFVAALHSGAELLATIAFTATTQEDKTALETKLKASYSLASGSLDVDLDESKAAENSQLQVLVTQVGGARGALPATHEELLLKLRTLANEAAEAPHFYDMVVVPYSSLSNWPKQGEGAGAESRMSDLIASTDMALLSLYHQIEQVLLSPAAFWPVPENGNMNGTVEHIALLNRLQDEVLEKRRLLRGLQGERVRIARTDGAGVYPGASTDKVCIDVFGYKGVSKVPCEAWIQDYLTQKLLTLPVPTTVALPLNNAAVVQHHVVTAAKKACMRHPGTAACMSNKEIEVLAGQVRPDYGTHLVGLLYAALVAVAEPVLGYLCIDLPGPNRCLGIGEQRTETPRGAAKRVQLVSPAEAALWTMSKPSKQRGLDLCLGHLCLLAADANVVAAPIDIKSRSPWEVEGDGYGLLVERDKKRHYLSMTPDGEVQMSSQQGDELWYFVRTR